MVLVATMDTWLIFHVHACMYGWMYVCMDVCEYVCMYMHLHLQLCDGDTTVLRGEVVAITPGSGNELRAVDDNFGQLDALAGRDSLCENVDAGVEAKDEASVVTVGDEVAASEQDLAGGRDGAGGVLGDGHGMSMLVSLHLLWYIST